MKLIDLTHTFTNNMPVYPGDPIPELKQIAYLHTEGFNDFQIRTGMHVGTHMDAPLHMIASGKRLSEMPIENFFGKGKLIDARGKTKVEASLLKNASIQAGDIIIVMTGWAKKFGQGEYYENYPEFDEDLAKMAVELGVKIVGMDTPSPDRPPFKVHKCLLGNGVLIIENLTNLEALLGVKEFELLALPVKFHAEAAPCRVIAKIL